MVRYIKAQLLRNFPFLLRHVKLSRLKVLLKLLHIAFYDEKSLDDVNWFLDSLHVLN